MENNNTCVWVKASERKPEPWKPVIARNILTGEIKATQDMGHDTGWDVAMDHKFQWNNTEWLDESPQQSAPASGKSELRENIFEILQERGSYVEQADKLESLFGQYAAQFQSQQSAPASGKGEILGHFEYDREKQTANYTPVSGKEVGEVKSAGIDLSALQERFDKLFAEPNIEEVFWQWYNRRYKERPPLRTEAHPDVVVLSPAEEIAVIMDKYDIGCPLEDSRCKKEIDEFVQEYAAQFKGQQPASNVEDKMEVLKKICIEFAYEKDGFERTDRRTKALTIAFEDFAEEAQTLISQLFSNSQPAVSCDLFKACIELIGWHTKYPPGNTYDYGIAQRIENELTACVEAIESALKKQSEPVSGLLAEFQLLRESLIDVDTDLAMIEDYLHGAEGQKITAIRTRIQQQLKTQSQ